MTSTGTAVHPAHGGYQGVGPAQPGQPIQGFGRAPGPDDAPMVSPLAGNLANTGGGIQGLIRTIKRRQGLFLFTFGLVTGAMALNTIRERIFSPVYQGGFQMQISDPFQSQLGGGGGTLESIARSAPKNDVPSLMILLRSPLLIQPLATRQGVAARDIIDNLGVYPAGDVQNVLNVNLRWRDPVKGRTILKELSSDYIKFSLNQRQATLDSGVDFLDKEAPSILRNAQNLQSQISNFRERNGFLDPKEMMQSIQEQQVKLQDNLQSLRVDEAQLRSDLSNAKAGRRTVVVSQVTADGVKSPTTSGNPLDELLTKYEQDLAAAKATYREDSPIVQSILARRNQLIPAVQKQVIENIEANLLANASQQAEINRQILYLSQRYKTNPAKMKEFDNLQERLLIARENYSSYIRAKETYRLERARNVTPWQIIAPPEFNDVPIEPNIQSNLMRALTFGLLAGLGAAILRERTDNVFHTPAEVERDLQLPVLGLIPYLPLDPGVDIATSISKMSSTERFAIKESLRSLFTTFRLLGADRNIRLVGITSSTQGEGKSTAVSVFGRTLADLGLRVLIIDADMRLPMQSRYLGTDQGDGLTTLLSDSTVTAKSFIQNIQENLDYLPAGPKPPDPAKLLNSIRCQEVVDELRSMEEYDIILFDAPPCLMLADPILLGEKLDGILFLVGLGRVSRDIAPQACRRIRATGVDLLGLICNQVNFPSRLNDYGYEYGYYYHYAYATQNPDRYNKGSGPKGENYVGRYVDRNVGRYTGTYAGRYAGTYAGRYAGTYPSSATAKTPKSSLKQGSAAMRYQKDATSVTSETEVKNESIRSADNLKKGSSGTGLMAKLKHFFHIR